MNSFRLNYLHGTFQLMVYWDLTASTIVRKGVYRQDRKREIFRPALICRAKMRTPPEQTVPAQFTYEIYTMKYPEFSTMRIDVAIACLDSGKLLLIEVRPTIKNPSVGEFVFRDFENQGSIIEARCHANQYRMVVNDVLRLGSYLRKQLYAALDAARGDVMSALVNDSSSTEFFTEDDLEGLVKAPDYILRPILPRGRIVLLVGNSTAGKTPLCYQLINDLLGNLTFLDYFHNESKKPLTVAIIDSESLNSDIKFRINRQRQGRPIKVCGTFLFTDRDKTVDSGIDVNDGLQKLLDLVKEHEVDVLIIDNLWGLSNGVDITKGYIASQVISNLNRIIALPHKPTVIVLHHPRKGTQASLKKVSILDPDFMSWMQELSGSLVWVNRTDVRLGLERVTVGDNEYTVLRGRHRVPDGEQDIGPLYLSVDEGHDIAKIDHSPELLKTFGSKMQEIALRMQLKGQFTTEEALSPEIRGTNASKRTLYRVLRTLKTHGFLHEENGVYRWMLPTIPTGTVDITT